MYLNLLMLVFRGVQPYILLFKGICLFVSILHHGKLTLTVLKKKEQVLQIFHTLMFYLIPM